MGNDKMHARNRVAKHKNYFVRFFFNTLSVIEVKIIDNQQWINVHAYMMQN
jgi:hypothetical protein